MSHALVRRGRLRLAGLAALALWIGALCAGPVAAPGQAGPTITKLAVEADRVPYGRHLHVSGSVEPPAAGRSVVLLHASSGGRYRPLARATTGPDGRYSLRVRPSHSGRLRAAVDGGPPSESRHVTVTARLRGRMEQHLLGLRPAPVTGSLLPGAGGRRVVLESRSNGRWITVARARTGRGGRFSAVWRPPAVGRHRLRLRFPGDRRNGRVSQAPANRVNVYRAARASWYGPGFYGRRTACGQIVRPHTLGVAHRHLRCGTRVTFHYRGRTVTVPVIDRGPYAGGRVWDLTAATKRALRFPSTGRVWSTR